MSLTTYVCLNVSEPQRVSESHFAEFVSHNLSYCGCGLFVLAACVWCLVHPRRAFLYMGSTEGCFNSNYRRKDTGTFYISARDFHWKPAHHRLIWTSTHFANIWLNPVSAAGRHVPINYLKRESLNSWQWPHAHFAHQHTLHTLFVLVVHFLILLTLFPAVET